jgi:hypothetical protein
MIYAYTDIRTPQPQLFQYTARTEMSTSHEDPRLSSNAFDDIYRWKWEWFIITSLLSVPAPLLRRAGWCGR